MSPGNFDEIKVFDDAVDSTDVIKTIIDRKIQEDAFYIVDIGDIINKHREWITKIPRVAPHYGMSALRTYVAWSMPKFKFAPKELRFFTLINSL